jgi:DNA-binding transcriptional ArsR family regulator
MQDDPELRRVLWFLLGGRRGGENRARIIRCIRERPRNLNQLANDLRLQYKAVQHHMRILVSNSLVVPSGEGYGTVYMPSPWFEHHFEMFEQICAKLGLGPSPSSKQDQVSGLATEGPDRRDSVGSAASH